MNTTKFEDLLNTELSTRDEDETIEAYLFLCRSKDRVRNAYRKKKLGTLIRKEDPYAFSSLENDYKREGKI